MATDKDQTDAVMAFIGTVSDIAKDSAGWTARVAEWRGHAENANKALQEAQNIHAAAQDHHKAGDQALAQAKQTEVDVNYWRDQCEKKEKAIAERETAVTTREQSATATEREAHGKLIAVNETSAAMDVREANLKQREEALAAEAARVQALLDSYDEAKHKAALQLAS